MSCIERMRLIAEEDGISDSAVSESEDLSQSPRKSRKKFPGIIGKDWLKTGFKSLARKCRIVDDTDDGKTNMIQTLFNVINANLGTGILAMPFVIRLGGYWGILITVFIGILGNYTGKVLISLLYEETAEGTRIRVRDTYADIGEAFHPTYGRYMVHVANGIEQFSHCVLLLIMPGTVIAHTFPNSGLNESAWIFFLALVIIPTIFLRKMHQVTWTCIMSVVIAVVISCCVLIYSLTHRTNWYDENMPDFDIHITPISLGIVMVTYSSQAYLPAIERCMRDPELFDPLIDFAYTLVTVFKFGIGVIVFLAFTDKTDQIMTLNLPLNFFGHVLNSAAIILSLSFFVVPMFTIFDVIENQIMFPKFCQPFFDTEKSHFGVFFLTSNLIFRFAIVMTFIGIAAAIPHFSLLMSFIGNTTGTILVLLYPCLFHVKIRWNELSNTEVVVNCLIIVFSFGGGALGINSAARAFYSIYNEKT